MIRVWLDDQRPAPPGWVHARSFEEARDLLDEHGPSISEVSLDHDLRPAHYDGHYRDCATGYDVLLLILALGLRPVVHIHTLNATGLQRLTDLLEFLDDQ